MKKFICTVCGYVHEGDEAPEFCPQCKQPKSKFKELVETEGALQFVDNRMVNTLLQRVGLEDEEGFQMKTAQLQSDEEEDTLQGKFEPTVQRVEDDAEGVQMK